MKNLIRSKEEQIPKQEAGIAKKTHEIASLEQSFSQRPIDSTSNNLYKESFSGRPYTRKFSSWMNVIHQQHNSHFHSDKWDSWEQRCSTVLINYIVLLVIRLCLRKSRIANFTVLNLNVNQPPDLLLILEPWELQFWHATFNIFIFIFYITVLTEILVVYQLNKKGLCSERKYLIYACGLSN